ncbi:MAG: flagellar protein FlaG [Micavibrio sp.]
MIEAVNSVLSNAPFTKAAVEQASAVRSFAANPNRVQEASLQAPYISLYIKVDTYFDKAVLQIRDSDTGDVVRQIPTESQLEAYRRAQSSNAVRSSEAHVPAPEVSLDIPDAPQRPASPEASAAPAPSPAAGGGDAAPSAPAPQSTAPASVNTQA